MKGRFSKGSTVTMLGRRGRLRNDGPLSSSIQYHVNIKGYQLLGLLALGTTSVGRLGA